MAKFAFIIVCDYATDDAEEFVRSIRDVAGVETLKTVEENDPNLSRWAIGDLIPVADSVSVEEAAAWLS